MPMGNLDYKAGLSDTEKELIKNTSVEGVYKDIKKQGRNLYNEIMNNVHIENMNKINDGFLTSVDLTINKIKDTIKGNPDISSRYEKAIAATKYLKDNGIALVQALAEDCVDGVKDITVRKNLKQTAYFTSAEEIDGYMWPNTTLLLEKIAKTDLGNGTPILMFDGTITPELILKMYNSCHTENIKKQTATEINTQAQLNSISSQIAKKQYLLDAITLTKYSTQAEKEKYKTLMREISDLQIQKESLMTPELLQKKIDALDTKITALDKTIKADKSNEFAVNSSINAVQSEKNNYERLHKGKIVETTITSIPQVKPSIPQIKTDENPNKPEIFTPMSPQELKTWYDDMIHKIDKKLNEYFWSKDHYAEQGEIETTFRENLFSLAKNKKAIKNFTSFLDGSKLRFANDEEKNAFLDAVKKSYDQTLSVQTTPERKAYLFLYLKITVEDNPTQLYAEWFSYAIENPNYFGVDPDEFKKIDQNIWYNKDNRTKYPKKRKFISF